VSKISIDQIVSQQVTIHPCLDWVNGQLIVGVNLKDGGTAVLSSAQGLIKPDGLGMVCELGKKFSGAVSPGLAEEFEKYRAASQEQRAPENGKNLLRDLATYLRRFVVFPQVWLPEGLATWILGTYLFPVFQTYPYLWITSAMPGCGKTALGGLIAQLSFNGQLMVAPTEAQLFHLPETSRGVQVWDEVENREETDRKKFSMILPVLLNGYRNGGAVPRQTGKHFETSAKFHVFCPRVLIGLTKLPEPALQRTIQVRLVMRTEQQSTELYIGEKFREEERRLRERCLLWALETADQVNGSYQDPDLRQALVTILGAGRVSDDIWLPVFAVASAATSKDEQFLNTLREAARGLSAASQKTISVQPQVIVKRHVEVPAETERTGALELALRSLEHSGPVTPQNLAQGVSGALGRTVTEQVIGKGLSKIGIKTKRKKGRRVFAPTPEERERAVQTLIGQEDRRTGRNESMGPGAG